MSSYLNMSKEQLQKEKTTLEKLYIGFKERELNLDMSRGKPGQEQLNLSDEMMDVLNSSSDFKAENGFDCRNYGLVDGIPEAKRLFAEILGVTSEEVVVGGNSSLNMMFDTIACFYTAGVAGCKPWCKQDKVKFLCPVPGYDRHFGVTGYFNIEMLNVPMTKDGPNMDIVEKMVAEDESIKGIWCVPKYSNPQGVTYSNETVKRFAALKPAAKDFRIMWDNAYCVHDVTDNSENLLNIMDECKKNKTEDMVVMFCSTSKITYPGAGVAAMAASKNNLEVLLNRYTFQTIGYDKTNMLRHVRYFKNYDGVIAHMNKHKAVLQPRFEAVLSHLKKDLGGLGVASWLSPNGGYFVSVDVIDGCAKRVVELCKNAGVVLTGAGATYPYGNDPKDSNIRIAPTFPPVEELNTAMELFTLCVKLAAVEKLIEK